MSPLCVKAASVKFGLVNLYRVSVHCVNASCQPLQSVYAYHAWLVLSAFVRPKEFAGSHEGKVGFSGHSLHLGKLSANS